MKTLYSITSDALSLLKLKLLDEQFNKEADITFKVVFIGLPSEMEELIVDIDYREKPLCIDVEPTTSSQETARAFLECETIFSLNKVDFILVPDASNAALASAIVGIKKPIPVLALEAGLRLHDRRQYSEINRKVIDSISELFFTTEAEASKNLLEEGVEEKHIYEVGSLTHTYFSAVKNAEGMEAHVLCYFSHPSNREDPVFFRELIGILNDIAYLKDIVLPLDNEIQNSLVEQGLLVDLSSNIKLIDPPSPKELLNYVSDSALVLTDNGTIQMIATSLEKQCITFGKKTEYPGTVERGTNHIIGTHLHEMRNLSVAILKGYKKESKYFQNDPAKEIKKVISLLI